MNPADLEELMQRACLAALLRYEQMRQPKVLRVSTKEMVLLLRSLDAGWTADDLYNRAAAHPDLRVCGEKNERGRLEWLPEMTMQVVRRLDLRPSKPRNAPLPLPVEDDDARATP